jgi:AraC-like DNA-binding protein
LASGQIAFWEGGSLWVFDVPAAAGATRRTDVHAHHAFQVTLSLGGTFTLYLATCDALPGPAAIVAPDAPHAFEACGVVALLFVDPESRAGRALAGQMDGRASMPLGVGELRGAQALIRQALAHPTDRRGALVEAATQICRRITGHSRTTEIDRRVRLMIRWAHENIGGTLGLREIAGVVGLSPSRASHLFVEETGLPFRTYVLWMRLIRAVDAHSGGLSLTEAAHEAGFSDSAHLSRTFRRMFGLPATALEMS